MSKKLEQSELEYIKDLLDSKTKNYMAIGQKYEQREILLAQANKLVNENLEFQSDFDKNMKKLEEKYGKVNIDLNDGSIQEIENDEQSNK